MSVLVTYDVACDRCNDWNSVGLVRGKRQARTVASSMGWVHRLDPETGKMVDICPDCLLEESQ